jgi:hypothetical protein
LRSGKVGPREKLIVTMEITTGGYVLAIASKASEV